MSNTEPTFRKNLGSDEQWAALNNERKAFREGTLTATEYDRLTSRCPGFELSRSDRTWNLMANAASAFYEAHKRHPLATAADPKESDLGKWLNLQRRLAAAG